jgi:hypothetical protein
MKHARGLGLCLALLFAACSSTGKYDHSDIQFIGPASDRLQAAASGVELPYTQSISYGVQCPSFAGPAGQTVVCPDDVWHTVDWLQRVLKHEDCHHKQIAQGLETDEGECEKYAQKGAALKMLLGIGAGLLLLKSTDHMP